jgi:hypothetical protein
MNAATCSNHPIINGCENFHLWSTNAHADARPILHSDGFVRSTHAIRHMFRALYP